MATLEENLARYEALIPHLHRTQMRLWGRVDEGMMRAACGLIESATGHSFLPRDDDSIALMLNYCCFHVRFPGGRSLVQVDAAEHTPESEDEREVLTAHLDSRFSLFEICELVPGIGARLRDLFTDEIILVVYPRLASDMRPGLVLPVRVMPLHGFHVLFNGPIPHNSPANVRDYEESILKTYGEHGVQKGRPLNEEEQANIEIFQTIAALSLRYPELISSNRAAPPARAPSTTPRFGQTPLFARPDVKRNDRCPCGSGKKYKQCCLPKN